MCEQGELKTFKYNRSQPICRVTDLKYLGLRIDDQLDFDLYMDKLKKTIAPLIAVIWRTAKYISTDHKKIYDACVNSHLLYITPIYGRCSQAMMYELRCTQSHVIKSIYDLKRDTSTSYLYYARLLPAKLLVIVETEPFVFRLLHDQTKHHFRVVTNQQVSGRTTRQG